MKLQSILLIVGIAAVGIPLVNYLIRAAWRIVSEYKRRAAERPPTPRADRHSIWHDPGDVSKLDLRWGAGGKEGVPHPPFRFIEEHDTGSSPNVTVQDANGRRWRVKWGSEVCAESFAARLVWAAGYHVEINYFVPAGKIEGASDLKRARPCINENQQFCDARFELDDKSLVKRFDEHGWAWNSNPFVGTHELHGLKILVTLLSNWDNKDVRDVARGSNTAIFYRKLPEGLIEAQYLIIDWGGSMGKWGTNIVSRGKWDAEGFASQTPLFVAGVADGYVKFGYTGQRTADATEGISIADVEWLMNYLNNISDRQLTDALLASGATDQEATMFVRSIRERLTRLQQLVSNGG